MSDSTVYNLLKPGAVKGYRLVPDYAWPGFNSPNDWTRRAKCVPGKTYTFSIVTDVAGEVCFGFYLADGSVSRPSGYRNFPAGKSVVETLTAPENAEYVAASWMDGNRRPMLVEGGTPAAWAPAEGETLAGGGASMSANLIDGIKPRLMHGTTESDGIFHHAAGNTTNPSHDDWLMWDLPDQAALATNQTYHIGLSVRGTSANGTSLHVTIGYKDAAEKKNYVTSSALAIGTSWGRVERTLVVPSGMRPFAFYVAAYGKCPEVWMASPTLSYGSPVALSQAEATVSYVKDGKSPTILVSKSGTVTTITVTNPDGSKSTQKVLDGTNGTPGAKGADGRTTYTHVKYSNDGGKTFTSNSGEDAGAYIGICTDFSSADPTSVGSYKWAKIKGDTGATGPQGPKGDQGAAVKSVTRYYQLLPSGSSAPSAPTSSSNLGSWTASEPSANTAKDLWQCERTKLDDGTETWSAVTKSSAYEAAKSVSADVRQLSDKVTATVSEQMKWNDSYSSRTSSLEQTAAGFSASLDSMSSTDASIHQWMSFGQGADGKPTLTIGTSGSDIVSKQTNSGLSYQTRGGTELMALDAASRSSTMPHMHADDVSIGNWQLGPTKNGTHFTLMWIGG